MLILLLSSLLYAAECPHGSDRFNCVKFIKNYDGGPVGIETISAALSEPRDALEEIVEPYLLQQGFRGPYRAAGRRDHRQDGL